MRILLVILFALFSGNLAQAGKTPLFIAAEKGHKQAIQTLIESGANPHKTNEKEENPLFIAVQKGHAAAVRYLVDAGSSTDKINEAREPLLYTAVKHGDIDMVYTLITGMDGIDVNKAESNYYDTPLHLAVKSSRTEADNDDNYTAIAVLLLQHGARINKRNKDNQSPFNMALMYNRKDILRYFLNNSKEQTVQANKRDTFYKKNPLQFAVCTGDPETVQLLIDAGAKVNPGDNLISLAQRYSCEQDFIKFLEEKLKEAAEEEKDKELCP
ncbi:MAG: ankyrin repeat domain-containing protein [Deltaproteobacteria bacterium]|nr:ankyrin repeat domain-containing protein [Deltaproteobacteria bacterium]